MDKIEAHKGDKEIAIWIIKKTVTVWLDSFEKFSKLICCSSQA